MTGTFIDVDAPNTAWRGGSEDPIPVILGRWSKTAFLYRFVTGRPLDGHARTDATFWHAGTKARTVSGHTAPYNYWPGWKRGLLITRLPAFGLLPWTVVSVGTDYYNVSDPWWLDSWAPAVGWLPILGYGGYSGVRYAQNYRFEKNTLRPLRGALINTLRTREGVKLDIPRDLVGAENPGPVGTVFLPPAFVGSDADRENLLEVARGRLSSTALEARFDMAGARPKMELFVPPQPPERISREIMLEHADTVRPYLGHSAYGAVHWDLGESSPHIGVVGLTGSGKSELAAWIVSQFMRAGAGTVVLDPKGTSHRWLMSIPQVMYCGTPSELTRAVLAIDRELARRAAVNRASDQDQDFPRLVVFLEERNSLQDVLREDWKENAPTGRRGEMAPAIRALGRIGAMGRSLNITLVMAAQETEARYIGTRAHYGAFAVAGRMAQQHWKTVGGTGFQKPGITTRPGAFGYVVGGQATVFQAAFPDVAHDPTWLRDWATQGEELLDARALLQQDDNAGMASPGPVAAHPVADDTIEMVTLRDMVQDGVTLVQLRTWRNRYPDFPAPVQIRGQEHWFSRADLASWIANRNGDDDA